MMEQRARPVPALRGVVQAFESRVADLTEAVQTMPLPARPDQFIEIYLAEPYRVSADGGLPAVAPEIALVGPQSYRKVTLHLSGQIRVFTIRFEPGGLHRLFGIPMQALVDEAAWAPDILGPVAQRLRVSVAAASSFAERVTAAEAWVGQALADAPPPDTVAWAARLVDRSLGRVRIDVLANRSGLSARQFSRRFIHQVGLPPKLYARTVRFNGLLAAREAAPWRRWTDLAHEAGYFDQAHFIRECRALAGDSPDRFFREVCAGAARPHDRNIQSL